MLSVKPGRGPSAMSALGGVVAVIFGIFWTVMASTITKDAPSPVGTIFPLFGVLFVVLGIVGVIYNLVNTVSPDRMSTVDITTGEEESDPIMRVVLGESSVAHEQVHSDGETIEGRLAKLDTLLREQAISNDEYQEQRKRILQEI